MRVQENAREQENNVWVLFIYCFGSAQGVVGLGLLQSG